MKSVVAAAAFAVLALGATPALAATTFHSDYADWSAAAASVRTVNINSGPNTFRLGDGDVTVTYDDVSFHQSAALGGAAFAYVAPGYYGATEGTLTSQQGKLGNILISLPGDTRAFSLNFDAWQYPHPNPTLTFLLSDGESFTLPSSGAINYPTPDFFGITSTHSFNSVLVTSDSLVMNISHVAYGVPEPAVWTMMLMGFFGLGTMLRRQRIALAA